MSVVPRCFVTLRAAALAGVAGPALGRSGASIRITGVRSGKWL
jgi:hypothetical protein